MTIWIPGKLVNPMNGSHGHWSKHATMARRQRETACGYLFACGVDSRFRRDPSAPKLVTFTAYVFNEFDDDNIRPALKPTRDALKDMQIINDDRPSAGHTFIYEQKISRGKNAKRGVEITVELIPQEKEKS